MSDSQTAWALYPYSEECRAAFERGASYKQCNTEIARRAAAAKQENDDALDDAIRSFVRAGASLEDLEIISEPWKGPGAWRVRCRRRVCDCGRSV